jgi:hypothetical protein
MNEKRIRQLWSAKLTGASGETLERLDFAGLVDSTLPKPVRLRLDAYYRQRYPAGQKFLDGLSHDELRQLADNDPAPLQARGWTCDAAGDWQPPAEMSDLVAEWAGAWQPPESA